MIAYGPLLVVFGIGFFCWLLFTFAVYALPCFAGITAGLAAFHSGAGVIGGIAVGFFAGAATLYAGQFAFAAVRSPLIRATIALLFAVPATFAGYHTTLGLTQFGVPSEGWRQIFAIVGAALVGATAWVRTFDPGPFAVGGRRAHVARPFPIAAANGAESEPARRSFAAGRMIAGFERSSSARRGRAAPNRLLTAPIFFSGNRRLTPRHRALGARLLVTTNEHRPPFPTPALVSLRLDHRTSCARRPLFATASPERQFGARTTRPLFGLIWPKDGCASIV